MRNLRSTLFLMLAALIVTGAIGCGAAATSAPPDTPAPQNTPAPDKATRAEMLQSLTAQVILPGYTAAAAGLAQLEQSLEGLCASPAQAGLDAARQDWRAARQGWLRTESYRFGPAMERRSVSLADWWPIEADKIDAHLDGGEEITEERVLEYLPATQRGLNAIEYLLFGPGSGALADGSGAERRCAYLRSLSAVARDEADGILADWQGSEEAAGYAGYFDGTGSLALLDSEAEAEAVRSLVFQVRAIANMRLGAALGIDGEADAGAIPSGDADNTREDLLSQLDGIAAVYRGADGGLGLSARVASVSEETDARMAAAIESTIAATESLGGSIIAQLEANPAQVRAVYDSMKELQRVLNTEIVSLLGVSVGFSDTDGDS